MNPKEVVVTARITRKKFFEDTLKYTAGAVVGVAGFGAFRACTDPSELQTGSWPWSYSKLDPETARKLGHDNFYKMGCCYGTFAGIILQLRDKIGEPFASLPLEMMSYGGGGVKGWGTLCGTLNAAAAAISLVRDGQASTPIINELMGWYTEALLPEEKSNQYAESGEFAVDKGIKTLAQNQSGSPLCHISVTKWCRESGFDIGSPEQKERCARVAGDVAAKAVRLLNAQEDGQFKAAYVMPASTAECLDCHGPEKEVACVEHKMLCVQCHGKPHEE